MSKKSQNNSQDKIAAKKAAVLGTEKKGKMTIIFALIGVAVIAGAAVFYLTANRSNGSAVASVPATTTGTSVSFPASLFDDGKARYFEHVDGDLTIRYFILKSSDGVIRAAFDACDVCWPAGKGYYQDGDYMVCRNCGRRFASVLVNEVQGGCNPAPLKRSMQNDNVVIQIKDLQEGGQYFNFDKKA